MNNKIKTNKIEKKAFSLIEIVISLAIFSFLITSVLTITLSMINAQKRVQGQLFLAQTAQTVVETMSRQLRYGYNYTGNTTPGGNIITITASDVSNIASSTATTSQNLINAENSPFIVFESQNGNPNDLADQNAFCTYEGMLYKISKFNFETNTKFSEFCTSGSKMLPDNIILENISFDIYGGDPANPKNPMVRIKLKIKHDEIGSMDLQTTVTQRLVTYF
jgi:prepilin-type N-terminal cleavage/methylation domain-containing protein